MPGFIKTPKDEELWSRAKARVKDQGKEGNWALVNFIYQKMKKKHGCIGRFEKIAFNVLMS